MGVGERFGEYVGNLVDRCDVGDVESVVFHKVMNKMVADVDVLRASVKLGISSDVDSGLVVLVDGNGLGEGDL